jgi:hypothetical protein
MGTNILPLIFHVTRGAAFACAYYQSCDYYMTAKDDCGLPLLSGLSLSTSLGWQVLDPIPITVHDKHLK